MVKWKEGNLISDKETKKNDFNLPKNISNGPLNNGRMYYRMMNQNLKFLVQREDSMQEEGR